MKSIYLSSLFILVSIFANAQKVKQPVILYSTTREFLNDNPIKTDVFAIVERFSANHFSVKKFSDENGKKVNGSMSAFAVKFEGESYFNLFYSTDINNPGCYAKFDIIGRYCAIIIDDKTPSFIRDGRSYYPSSAGGALMKDSVKWGKAWLDKDGNKKRILFIDTLKYVPEVGKRNGGSLGNYLTRSQLSDILNEHKIDIQGRKAKELSFEEVIQFINEMNTMDKV